MVLSLYLGVCSCWLYLERETFTLWSLESLVSAGTPDGQLLSSTMAQRLKLKATPLNLLLWTKITHDNIQLCWPTCSSFDSWVYLHAWLEKRCRTRWECKAYFNWYFEVSKHHGESTIASLRNFSQRISKLEKSSRAPESTPSQVSPAPCPVPLNIHYRAILLPTPLNLLLEHWCPAPPTTHTHTEG